MMSRLFQCAHKLNPFSLTQTYQKEVVFLFALGIAGFYLTAISSFTLTDPSLYSFSHPEPAISNLAGSLGAFIAALCYYHLGIVSFLIPIPFLYMAVLYLKGNESAFSKARLWGWFFGTLAVLSLMGNFLPHITKEGMRIPSAGSMGAGLSNFLVHYLGALGFVIFSLTFLICGLLLLTQKSFFRPARLLPDVLMARFILPILERCSGLFSRKKTVVATASTGTPIDIQVPVMPREAIAIPPPAPVPAAPMHGSVAEAEELTFKDRIAALRKKKEAVLSAKTKPEPDAEKKEGAYAPPSIDIFKISEFHAKVDSAQLHEFEITAQNLVNAFADFSIKGEVVGIQPGPVVTVFEFEAVAGTKLAKMLSLIDDIALAMKVDSIFIHPVSGKRAVGIQVPNKRRDTVFLGDVLSSETFRSIESPLTFAMGKSLKGEPICADITTMPHLLMAGQTGAGKSVAINSLLCSVIMKASPDEVRMILVDPKILELKIYEGIPHLLMPVITEPSRAAQALKWAAIEMDRRYRLMETAKVRHIAGFNSFWERASEEEKIEVRSTMAEDEIDHLPYILIVIDELADLMLTAPKDVESYIQRLAQKARACGIHLVLATQRPSVDVITGVIKANLPCRIAFKVFSRTDSRTILDAMGADKLLGKGDMLYLKPGTSKFERIQGAFLADEEVVNLVDALRDRYKTNYDQAAINWIDQELDRQSGERFEGSGDDVSDDPKWDEAVAIGQKHGIISASFLQRHLKIGYNRAARIVESMEAQGMVEQASGSKPRRWLGGGAIIDPT